MRTQYDFSYLKIMPCKNVLQVTLVTYVVKNTSLQMVVSEMYPLQKENAGEMTAQILFT